MKYISRCLQILSLLKCRPGGLDNLDMIYTLILHLNIMYFFLAINLQLERLF